MFEAPQKLRVLVCCAGLAAVGLGLIFAAPTLLCLGGAFMGMPLLVSASDHKELSAGRNDPAPEDFEDWDVNHPWADGSPRATAISLLRRDLRTDVISQETYSVELDLIFEERSEAYWEGEERENEEMKARVKSARPGRERKRLREQFESNSMNPGIIILPEGARYEALPARREDDRTVEALLYREQNAHLKGLVQGKMNAKQPLYVKRWRQDGTQVQFLASEILSATQREDGAWTYRMTAGSLIGPVYVERPRPRMLPKATQRVEEIMQQTEEVRQTITEIQAMLKEAPTKPPEVAAAEQIAQVAATLPRPMRDTTGRPIKGVFPL